MPSALEWQVMFTYKLGVEIGVVTLTFIKNKPNPAPENYIPSSLQAAFELRPEPIR